MFRSALSQGSLYPTHYDYLQDTTVYPHFGIFQHIKRNNKPFTFEDSVALFIQTEHSFDWLLRRDPNNNRVLHLDYCKDGHITTKICFLDDPLHYATESWHFIEQTDERYEKVLAEKQPENVIDEGHLIKLMAAIAKHFGIAHDMNYAQFKSQYVCGITGELIKDPIQVLIKGQPMGYFDRQAFQDYAQDDDNGYYPDSQVRLPRDVSEKIPMIDNGTLKKQLDYFQRVTPVPTAVELAADRQAQQQEEEEYTHLTSRCEI